jgi:hypothetical protein
VGRLLPIGLVVCFAAALGAAPAEAGPQKLTFTSKEITVDGYAVEKAVTPGVARPQGDGFITEMAADVVDPKTGREVPISRIMLHHIVFAAYGNGPGNRPFYGDGEERAIMKLPPGYGYRVEAADKWAIVWMLMNHRAQVDSVKIRWTLTWDDDPTLKPVTPMSFDASRGRQGLVYDVAGDGRPGSRDVRTHVRQAPFNGRIVAGLGHVHGGAYELTLSQPACGDRPLYRSRPTWGLASHPFYKVKPILHEPGPINMSRLESRSGIPVRAGEDLKLSSVYDNSRLHTRAMGLMLVYLARDEQAPGGCPALPGDVKNIGTSTPGRSKPPVYRVPLTGLGSNGRARTIGRPPGSLLRGGLAASLSIGDAYYTRQNISIRKGGRVTWKFTGDLQHDVTVADGPRGFSSDWQKKGTTFTRRFDVPGRYKLFCSLHPVQMTQVVNVRKR